jgi:serine protease
MKLRVLHPLVALAGLVLLGASAEALNQMPPDGEIPQADFVRGEILVKFRSEASRNDIEQTVVSRGASILGKGAFGAYFRLAVPARQEWRMARLFGGDPDCEWATPNFLTYSHSVALEDLGDLPPDDPLFIDQINLELINILDAWQVEAGDAGVVVAVLDTGVAYEDRPIPDHELDNVLPGNTQYLQAPDLAQTSFVPGFDLVNGDPNANDDHFHGTFVAGTVAQSTNNGLGAAGTAPGVTIMPIKVLNQFGIGAMSAFIDGINFAAVAGADVVNISLGFSPLLSLGFFDFFFVGLDNALQVAHDAGVVLVASSGNAGIGVVSRPALNPHVIAVGASNFDGLTRASYSQHSRLEFLLGIPALDGLPGNIEIVAPVGDGNDLDGNGLPDAVIQQSFEMRDPDNFDFFLAAGTSFSAPQVSAVAALLISNGQRGAKSAEGVETIRQILRDTAVDLGFGGPDLLFGAGQLDAGAALNHSPD